MESQIQIPDRSGTAAALEKETTRWEARFLLQLALLGLVIGGLWIIYQVEEVIFLLILAILFAYLVAPLVEFAGRPFRFWGGGRTLPRPLAIGVVYLALFGAVGLTIYLILPHLGNQLTQFGHQLPDYVAKARGWGQSFNNVYHKYNLPDSVRVTINNAAAHLLEGAEAYLTTALSDLVGSLSYLPTLLLIPILAFFLLNDAEQFRRSALRIFPRGRLRWRIDELFQDMNRTLALYIRSQITACLIVGLVCSIGFYLIGVPYALVLGVAAGLLEFIPLAGPVVVVALTTLLASFHSFGQALEVIVFFFVMRVLEDYVVYPRLIGQGLHLHPLVVILTVLCAAKLAGIAGIFLAVPIAGLIAVSYQHWLQHHGIKGIVADLLKPTEQASNLIIPDAGSVPITVSAPTVKPHLP